MSQVILGGLEIVTIPSLGIETLAKVDTGAFSGALHCTNIHVHDGLLSFWPLGDQDRKVTTDIFTTTTVVSASGHASQRYLIPLTITIQGCDYDIVIGLSDRANLTREMLLGRRFLIENNVLVDVSRTKDIDDEAEANL